MLFGVQEEVKMCETPTDMLQDVKEKRLQQLLPQWVSPDYGAVHHVVIPAWNPFQHQKSSYSQWREVWRP
jgi:hypothetical protein